MSFSTNTEFSKEFRILLRKAISCGAEMIIVTDYDGPEKVVSKVGDRPLIVCIFSGKTGVISEIARVEPCDVDSFSSQILDIFQIKKIPEDQKVISCPSEQMVFGTAEKPEEIILHLRAFQLSVKERAFIIVEIERVKMPIK